MSVERGEPDRVATHPPPGTDTRGAASPCNPRARGYVRICVTIPISPVAAPHLKTGKPGVIQGEGGDEASKQINKWQDPK